MTVTPKSSTCPDCLMPFGGQHDTSCRILAEVITDGSRGADRIRVVAGDTAATDCGCPAVLVRRLGGRGHDHGCRRISWMTAVDPPTRITELTTSWAAAWADETVSVCWPQSNAPEHTAWHVVPGFGTWHAAAAYLDGLPLHLSPLGVFASASRHAIEAAGRQRDPAGHPRDPVPAGCDGNPCTIPHHHADPEPAADLTGVHP